MNPIHERLDRSDDGPEMGWHIVEPEAIALGVLLFAIEQLRDDSRSCDHDVDHA